MPFNHAHQWLRQLYRWAIVAVACAVPFLTTGLAQAASNGANDFNVQVSPSPLVATLTPGQHKTATITVRNFSNHSETLYPRLNSFSIDKQSKDIKLLETAPADLQRWISFKESSLAIAAGGSQTLSVIYNTPSDVGFSYATVVTLSRSPSGAQSQDISLRGSVAVFNLINIDRKDAKRALAIASITSDKSRYSYLPATFTLRIENTGNVVDQPKGTLFIQREFDDNKPLATIPLNQNGNYILPGTSRDFTETWGTGFPRYVTDGSGKRHLSWDWKHLSDLRIGKYVAKVVLVYNDGQRDVPVIASRTFWVIPWTLILVTLLVITVLVMGFVGWGRLIFKGARKVRGHASRRR